MTRFTLNPMMATRAKRSPPTPPPDMEPPTITVMPPRTHAMARHVRPEVRSCRAIRARTAAKIGPAAMMATTLDTAVSVTAVRNAVVPIADTMPVVSSWRRQRIASTRTRRPRDRVAIDHATGVEKRPTMKAMVQPSISESRSATRMSSESVETRNIPVKARRSPSWRPERGIASRGRMAIAGH